MLPYLSQASLSNTIGVQGATLYDIIDNNNGNGSVSVGASTFNVTCGSVQNVTVSMIQQFHQEALNITYRDSSWNAYPIGRKLILPIVIELLRMCFLVSTIFDRKFSGYSIQSHGPRELR
jgi:hypothetical protein